MRDSREAFRVMSPVRAASVSWGALAVVIAAALGMAVVAADFVLIAFVLHNADPVYLAISILLAVDLLLVGAYISLRRPGNAIGPLLLLSGLGSVASFSGGDYAAFDRFLGGDRLPFVPIVVWVASWSFVPTLAALAVYLPLLFPDGRLHGRRWRIAAFAIAPMLGLAWIEAAFSPGRLQVGSVAITNPFAFPPPFDTWPEIAGQVGTVLAPIAFGTAVVGVVARFRRSSGIERAQLKWFVLFASIAAIAFVPAVFNVGTVSDVAWLIGLSALAILPLAIGMAMVRYRLYEIDRIISRTIAYAVVTGTLLGIFGVLVLALQTALEGITQHETIPVAVSTVTVASLFLPLRRRVQDVVDRRFNRARLDDEQTVAAFAVRLRDEVDIGRLETALTSVAAGSLQPTMVGVWLRPSGKSR